MFCLFFSSSHFSCRLHVEKDLLVNDISPPSPPPLPPPPHSTMMCRRWWWRRWHERSFDDPLDRGSKDGEEEWIRLRHRSTHLKDFLLLSFLLTFHVIGLHTHSQMLQCVGVLCCASAKKPSSRLKIGGQLLCIFTIT